MEVLTLNLGRDEIYDQLVHGGLPQASGIQVVTKDKGTDQGNPVAVIAFEVQLPDGTIRAVQATTTVRLLQLALAGLRGRYGDV